MLSCHDTQQLIELLAFTRKLFLALLAGFVDHFVSLGGLDVFLLLLKNSSEEVRLLEFSLVSYCIASYARKLLIK